MQNSFSKTNKVLAIVLVLFVVSVALASFVFGQIIKKDNEISTVSGQISEEVQKNNIMESLKKIAKSTEGDRAKIDSYLVNKDGVVQFIEELEALGKSSSLKTETTSVSVSNSDDRGNQSLVLQIKTTGSWANSMYFLALLEKIPFNVKINTLSFNVSDKSSHQWEMNTNISVALK